MWSKSTLYLEFGEERRDEMETFVEGKITAILQVFTFPTLNQFPILIKPHFKITRHFGPLIHYHLEWTILIKDESEGTITADAKVLIDDTAKWE